jgi:hypothetical protein
VRFVIALVLAATLAAVVPTRAGTGETPAEGAATGIGVRGHWVIQVADPDGTVVAVREFHNALVPTGEAALVILLGGNRSVGGFAVGLLGSPPASSPCGAGGCFVTEPRHPFTPNPGNTFKTLSKIVATTPSPFITLHGSFPVPSNGAISVVRTNVTLCAAAGSGGGVTGPSTISPAACQFGSADLIVRNLTEAALPNPVQVVAGQTVLATVTLSFGTATPPAAASR